MKKIIVLLMLIISVKGSGQVLQKPAVYGYEFRRLAVDTLFAVPADTFSVPASLQSFPFIARKGTSFYFWNTSTHVWAAFSAAGATPTWQQTLTAGSTLTGNNTISGGGFDFTFGDSKEFIIGTTGSSAYFYADASRTGAVSFQRTRPDSIIFAPHLGQLNIDTLRVATNENSLIGWQTSTGRTGYVTLGSGLSLSSGVLSSSGGTPGGSDTYIQFNDGGSFGGDAGFTYNKTTNVFSTNNGAYRPTGTISFSDAGAGSVYRSSSDGLVFRAVTGSGYDLLMYDAVGNGVFGIEAGTSKLGSTSQIGAGLLGYGSWNAWMNLRGGTTTNASLTIRDGVAPSSPAEGQIWRTTDKVYNVIQTGAATKEFTLNDIALTSGRIPYTTTNGRLTDTATFLRSPGGNVGIGTSSPATTFHVAGSLRFVTGNQGAGKVMVSDGSGNADWAATSTLSGLPYWPLSVGATLTGNVDMDMNSNTFSLTNASGNGTTFSITDGGGSAYFDNTAHDIKVGIGTATPSVELDVVGNINTLSSGGDNNIVTEGDSYFGDKANNYYIRVGGVNSDGLVQMRAYGAGAATFDASGNISSVSDIRLKNVQGGYNIGLSAIMKIKPIVYKWNEKSKMETEHNYIGFSAQNILSALGQDATGINKDGYLSIQDRAIMATMVVAIQEQQKQIEELKNEIKKLKRK